jgi:hypothetical protein
MAKKLDSVAYHQLFAQLQLLWIPKVILIAPRNNVCLSVLAREPEVFTVPCSRTLEQYDLKGGGAGEPLRNFHCIVS